MKTLYFSLASWQFVLTILTYFLMKFRSKRDPLNYASNQCTSSFFQSFYKREKKSIILIKFYPLVYCCSVFGFVCFFLFIVVLFFPSRRTQHLPCLWCFIITAVSAGKIRKASWFWAEEETVFHSELTWMTGRCFLTFLCLDTPHLQSY